MKTTRFFASAIACIALATSFVVKADDYKEGVAKVVRIYGSADYAANDGAQFQSVKLGQYLSPGAIIRTGKDCKVDVVVEEGFDFTFRPDPHLSAFQPPTGFPPPRGVIYVPPARQTRVRLMGNTTLKLDKIEYYTTGADTVSHTEVDIQAGTIFFNVKKLTALSTFKMKTQISVASIRGSSGWNSANGDTGMFTGSEEVNGHYVDSNGNTQTYTQIISEGQSLLNNAGNNGGSTPSGPPSIVQNVTPNSVPNGFGTGDSHPPTFPGGSNQNNNNPSTN